MFQKNREHGLSAAIHVSDWRVGTKRLFQPASDDLISQPTAYNRLPDADAKWI